jgi:hypothetical protein
MSRERAMLEALEALFALESLDLLFGVFVPPLLVETPLRLGDGDGAEPKLFFIKMRNEAQKWELEFFHFLLGARKFFQGIVMGVLT